MWGYKHFGACIYTSTKMYRFLLPDLLYGHLGQHIRDRIDGVIDMQSLPWYGGVLTCSGEVILHVLAGLCYHSLKFLSGGSLSEKKTNNIRSTSRFRLYLFVHGVENKSALLRKQTVCAKLGQIHGLQFRKQFFTLFLMVLLAFL